MSVTELFLPDQTSLDAAADAIAHAFVINDGAVAEFDRTFYDTFDGLVRASGLSVVHERGRLSLVERDSGRERAGLAITAPARPLLAAEIRPGPLRDALRRVIEVRALVPLARVHTRNRMLGVLDDEHKTVVRLALEQPRLISGEPGLRPRLRLAAVRGYDDELQQVQHTLETRLGFREVDEPLVDEAVSAAGGVPGGTSSKVEVPLSSAQRADAAAVAVLSRLLEVIESNLAGTLAGTDSEFLHDLRVAVRRSRAVQRELKSVFPPADLARFREEFRWVQQATGEVRDLDVYLLELDTMRELVPEQDRAALEPLRAVLAEHRAAARRAMTDVLSGTRASALLADWSAFLEQLVESSLDHRPGARRSVADLAGARIRKVYKRMLAMGGAIDAASPAEDFHELRKRGKELRYLLELFATPLYPGEIVKPMIKALKALQDVLGRHQDREVQIGTLRLLAPEVCARPGGPAAVLAMGMLVQRLREDEQAARAEFADRFAAFSSASQRRLVKETFA